jgi:apolipoprotein N-acyltransferase
MKPSQRIPSTLYGLLEPLAHLVYVFGIAGLIAFTKFLAAAVFALVGFVMLLRLRKWIRRVTGTTPGGG